MHIAVFIYCLRGGGAQKRTVTLANGFAARGHQVDVVVVASEESRGVELHPAIRLVPLDRGWRQTFEWLNRRVNVRGVFTAGATPVLARYLRRERPDVLLSAASHVNLVALFARRWSRSRVPLVLRVSNYPSGNLHWSPRLGQLVRSVLRRTMGRVYPWADHVICVSRGVAGEVRKLCRLDAAHVTTIDNPVVGPHLAELASAPVEHPWLVDRSVPVVIGVGRMTPQKDFPTLLRAFARLRAARPVRLVICGGGHGLPAMQRLARELGIDGDVSFAGHVNNPLAWMARASVFVLPSAWEGLPGVLIEALACGCPVVSTDCPSGPREILDDGALGRLVPVGDDRAMAEAIAATLDAPPARETLVAGAARYAIEPAVDAYLAVLSRFPTPSAGS